MPSLDFDAERAAFRDFYDTKSETLANAQASFLTLIRSLMADTDFSSAVTSGRIKDREEAIKKFSRKYQTALEEAAEPYEIKDHITDLIGLRVVCLYDDQIEPIGALIRDQFEVLGVTDKVAAIEGTENAFGYKGLHLDLKLNAQRAEMPEYRQFAPFRFELQIRTIIQDSWSTLDHKIKYKKSITAGLKRRINTLAALFELADREFRFVREETLAEIERAKVEDNATDDADDRPADTEDQADVEPGQYAPLNAFRFLRIAHHFFPHFIFEPQKVDGFTAEIIRREPGISRGKFNFYLRENLAMVRRYKDYFLSEGGGSSFTAFTEIRHALFAANPARFGGMIDKRARDSFETWRRDHPNDEQPENPRPQRTRRPRHGRGQAAANSGRAGADQASPPESG